MSLAEDKYPESEKSVTSDLVRRATSSSSRVGIELADREGFEPSIPFWGILP